MKNECPKTTNLILDTAEHCIVTAIRDKDEAREAGRQCAAMAQDDERYRLAEVTLQ